MSRRHPTGAVAAEGSARARRWRRTGLALASYLLLAFVSFLPQSLHPRDSVAYVGDALESVYLVAWNVHQSFRAPMHLFDANVLHPTPHALALTDHRLVPSLAVAPVLWLSGGPVLAYNVAVALACLLAAGAARRLALVLGVGELGAWVAGALYAFHTYQINEAPRLNVVFHGFIALALTELIRLLVTGCPRHAWCVAGWMLLQGLSSNYHLLYGTLILGVVVAGALLARPRVVATRLPALAAAAGVAALLYLPIGLLYLRVAGQQGFGRELPLGIDVQHYFSTAPTNLLYGPIGLEVRRQQQGPHFVGFAALALAGVALLGAGWGAATSPERGLLPVRVWVPASAGMALLLAALALGRDVSAFGHHLGPGPYRVLHALVPGFQLVRIPERLSLLAMLFVALLAGHGLTLIAARWRTAAFLLALLVPIEHVSPVDEPQRVPVGRGVPAVYNWLASAPLHALAEVPIHGEGLVRRETLEMYFSTYHWRPIIHGYTAYPPLLARVLRRAAAEFPSEASLQVLQRVGVDAVVVHHGRTLGSDLFHQIPGAAGDERERFERLADKAQLDLYRRLPEAVAAGRLRREARFEGEAARLFESTADEVYRLVPLRPATPAPFPSGRRLRDASWHYRTKAGDPMPAADADMTTAWSVPRQLRGDEFFEVTFDQPLRVAGLVLRLRRDSVFPTRFRVAGRARDRSWTELARFDAAHALQLVERLLADPRDAALGFELQGRDVTGLALLVEEGGTSFEGWSVPEVEVWVP